MAKDTVTLTEPNRDELSRRLRAVKRQHLQLTGVPSSTLNRWLRNRYGDRRVSHLSDAEITDATRWLRQQSEPECDAPSIIPSYDGTIRLELIVTIDQATQILTVLKG